jgi:glycosyltransferase involved in cell wall biosynthesis
MKKVLVITYYFPPSGGAGVQRWLKMMKYLPTFGVQPVVLTVDPLYASYPQCDESLLADVSPTLSVYRTKTSEVLGTYKKLSPQKEIPHTGFSNEQHPTFLQKVARFIRGNFFLPDPRRGWNKFAYREAVKILEKEQIDTIITTSPPHSTQLIGLKLKKKYPHLHWIADLRDPWSQLFYNQYLYQTPLAKYLNAQYERKVLQHADRVLTVSEDCVKTFPAVTKHPMVVLPNGFDPADFEGVEPLPASDKKVLSYVGVFGPEYGADALVDALKQLPAACSNNLLLRMVGHVNDTVKAKLQSLPIEVQYTGYVSHKEAIRYMCATDALLLCIPQVASNKAILTGKLFEYMAARKPIMLVGPVDGNAAALVNQLGIGYVADYEALGIATMIQKWQKEPFIMPDACGIQAFSRKEIARKLAHLVMALEKES